MRQHNKVLERHLDKLLFEGGKHRSPLKSAFSHLLFLLLVVSLEFSPPQELLSHSLLDTLSTSACNILAIGHYWSVFLFWWLALCHFRYHLPPCPLWNVLPLEPERNHLFTCFKKCHLWSTRDSLSLVLGTLISQFQPYLPTEFHHTSSIMKHVFVLSAHSPHFFAPFEDCFSALSIKPRSILPLEINSIFTNQELWWLVKAVPMLWILVATLFSLKQYSAYILS